MPAFPIYYANTASSGGDGTTNALSGANAAFASLTTALSTIRGNYANDYVVADVQPTLKLEGTGAFGQVTENTAVNTDATHFLSIVCEGAFHHAGFWDTGKPRISGAAGTSIVRLLQYRNLRVKGLQIENTSALSGVGGLDVTVTGNGLDVRVEECLIRSTGAATSHAAGISGSGGTSGGYTFANNIVIGFSAAGGMGIRCGSVGPSHTVYANTVLTCESGITRANASGTGLLKDNRVSGCTSAITGGSNWASMDYCATDLATLGAGLPAGTGNRVSQTFTDLAGKPGLLDATDAGARDVGLSLVGDATFSVTTDVTGAARSGTWDIGAAQAGTAGGGGTSKPYYTRRRRR